MNRIKIIKNADLKLLERDINEFLIAIETSKYYDMDRFRIKDIKLIYDSNSSMYIVLIIYEVTTYIITG